jgi:hypothetical protein
MPGEIAKKLSAELTDVMMEGLLPGFTYVMGAHFSDVRQLQLKNQLQTRASGSWKCR